METKRPDWLPDWKDDSAYPAHVEDWIPFQWVWAFIRRNEEYRADYEYFASLPSHDSDPRYPTQTSKWSGRSASLDDDMSLRYCKPPSLPGETYRQYWARLNGKVEVEMPLEERLMERWGIGNLPDPSDELGYQIIFHFDDSPPEELHLDGPDIGGYVPPAPSPDECGQVTLRFDLRFDIDKQIARAKEIIQERKDNSLDLEKLRASTPRKKELLKYLRAFDARTVGTSYEDIGAKLYPEKNGKNSNDAMKQSAYRAAVAGKYLVEFGYKTLLKFW